MRLHLVGDPACGNGLPERASFQLVAMLVAIGYNPDQTMAGFNF